MERFAREFGITAETRILDIGGTPDCWALLAVQLPVLSYTVGDVKVLDMPGFVEQGGRVAFTRTIRIGPSSVPLTTVLCDLPGGVEPPEQSQSATLKIKRGDELTLARAAPMPKTGSGAVLEIIKGGRAALRLPRQRSTRFCETTPSSVAPAATQISSRGRSLTTRSARRPSTAACQPRR